MGRYNQWMNENLHEVLAALPHDELVRDRGVFFGSLLGTCNHLLVGDTIWLQRFAAHPAGFSSLLPVTRLPQPSSLRQIIHSEFAELRKGRQEMDEVILDFVDEVREKDYEQVLSYSNTRNEQFNRQFGFLVQHMFNHQTHHRGQLTALLSQMELDYGVTDLLVKIPQVP